MKRRSPILTNLFLSLPLATGLLCAATNASAQTSASFSKSVTVPFEFTADHLQMPAGDYRIRLLSDYLISLTNIETAKTQLVMVRPEGGGLIETRGRLIFQRAGTEYSLTQVRVAGTKFYSALTARPQPRQAVANKGPVTGSSIEVAVK